MLKEKLFLKLWNEATSICKCISQVLYFPDALITVLLTLEGLLLPGLASFLRKQANHHELITFSMQTNKSRTLNPTNSAICLSHPRPLSTSSNHPRTTYQITRGSPKAPEPAEIIHTSHSEACLPCLSVPCCGNCKKVSYPHFYLFL